MLEADTDAVNDVITITPITKKLILLFFLLILLPPSRFFNANRHFKLALPLQRKCILSDKKTNVINPGRSFFIISPPVAGGEKQKRLKLLALGRPPIDKLMLFKICLLQNWYGLSDEQAEYQINDRLSFQRFLGIDLNVRVPDRNTIWTFKEQLSNSGAEYDIFASFVEELEEIGIVTREGSIVDATFVEVPRQRNNRDENKKIKSGETPESWNEKKLLHKDTDARWTKKNNETYYGYNLTSRNM